MRMWKIAAACAAVGVLIVAAMRPAEADILINISKESQRMSVLVDGTAKYNWLVSTGSKRYTTPSGAYNAQWMAKKWRSKQWNNAPMPHSIFFHKGYAIHGTTEIKRLGKIASHGCVRLHPDNAAQLYSLVAKDRLNTRIVVSDDVIDAPPDEKAPVKPKRKPSQYVAEAPADTATKPEMASAAQDTGAKLKALALAQETAVVASDAGAKRETVAIAKDAGAERRAVARKRYVAEKAVSHPPRSGKREKHQREVAKPVRERFARAQRRGGFYW